MNAVEANPHRAHMSHVGDPQAIGRIGPEVAPGLSEYPGP